MSHSALSSSGAAGVSLLIDSNIFIAVEDHGGEGHVFGEQAAELMRLAAQLNFSVAVSHGTREDLLRASPEARVRMQRQLERYHVLDQVPIDPAVAVAAQFPAGLGDNDRVDLEILCTLLSGAADWLITNDSTRPLPG